MPPHTTLPYQLQDALPGTAGNTTTCKGPRHLQHTVSSSHTWWQMTGLCCKEPARVV